MLNHWLLPMVAAHCAATLGRLGVAGASMWQWCSMPRKATRYSIAWLLARPRGDPDVLADGHLGPDGPVLVLGHHIPPFHLVFRQPRPGANRPRKGRLARLSRLSCATVGSLTVILNDIFRQNNKSVAYRGDHGKHIGICPTS